MPKIEKMLPALLPEPEVLDIPALAGAILNGEVQMVCVLGPTASGKTRYAVALAQQLRDALSPASVPGQLRDALSPASVPGQLRDALSPAPMPEIISADSRQIYRGMDIGTGKDLAEYGDVPYHLIDIADPGTQYNVYRFCQDFSAAFADIRSRGTLPVLCGGTGLYINAVTGGYDFRSSRPLSAPDAGRSGNVFFIGTLVDREERNARIDARLRARLGEGLVEEVGSLLDGSNAACRGGKPVPAETLISYGLEYKYVTLYLQGLLTKEELFIRLSTAIHQFAKRQMTWFRGMERSGVKIHWVRP